MNHDRFDDMDTAIIDYNQGKGIMQIMLDTNTRRTWCTENAPTRTPGYTPLPNVVSLAIKFPGDVSFMSRELVEARAENELQKVAQEREVLLKEKQMAEVIARMLNDKRKCPLEPKSIQTDTEYHVSIKKFFRAEDYTEVMHLSMDDNTLKLLNLILQGYPLLIEREGKFVINFNDRDSQHIINYKGLRRLIKGEEKKREKEERS